MSDNTSIIDATRTMLRALNDNPEGLESIWRGAATREQLENMVEVLELAQVSTAEKRHMQEAARLAAEREAKPKASFPHAVPAPATQRGANKAPATSSSSRRDATPPRSSARRRDVTPPPSVWADITDNPEPQPESEPQWLLDMAKHTLAEQMAKLKDKQEKEREELQATSERQLIERFRKETRTDKRDSDELDSADTDGGWPALEAKHPNFLRPRGRGPAMGSGEPASSSTTATSARREPTPTGAWTRETSVRRRDRIPLGIPERFSRDDKGRVDMSYRHYPTSELPPGHRRGKPAKGIGKGIHLQNVKDDCLIANPDFGGSLMPLVPEIGYVRCRSGEMTGRGRWDAKNEIFRCVILCPECEGDSCNQRQWTVYEQHGNHRCKTCHRQAGGEYSD